MNIYTFTEGITGKVPVHVLAQNCQQAEQESNLNPRVWVMKCVTKEYRGFTIEKETEPWAIKYGNNVRFYRDRNDDRIHSASTVKEAMDEIDERIIDKL